MCCYDSITLLICRLIPTTIRINRRSGCPSICLLNITRLRVRQERLYQGCQCLLEASRSPSTPPAPRLSRPPCHRPHIRHILPPRPIHIMLASAAYLLEGRPQRPPSVVVSPALSRLQPRARGHQVCAADLGSSRSKPQSRFLRAGTCRQHDGVQLTLDGETPRRERDRQGVR